MASQSRVQPSAVPKVYQSVLADAEVQARFWAKVNKADDCWEWTAGKNKEGYGVFSLRRQPIGAHRFAYELSHGPIQAKLAIDHLCRNHSCVRPEHMEPVTSRENSLRGQGPPALNAKKTQCPRGHPYNEENTIRTKRRERLCRTCKTEEARLFQLHRNRATRRRH